MNNDARNDATNQPVSLNHEGTPDADVFYGTTPAVHYWRRRRLRGGGVFIAIGWQQWGFQRRWGIQHRERRLCIYLWGRTITLRRTSILTWFVTLLVWSRTPSGNPTSIGYLLWTNKCKEMSYPTCLIPDLTLYLNLWVRTWDYIACWYFWWNSWGYCTVGNCTSTQTCQIWTIEPSALWYPSKSRGNWIQSFTFVAITIPRGGG